jgi:DNA-binding transcriptional MerR regulator
MCRQPTILIELDISQTFDYNVIVSDYGDYSQYIANVQQALFMASVYGPAQVCKRFGISKSTLLRWEAEGHVPVPDRDFRGERRYTQAHFEAIARFVQSRRHRRRYARILAQETQEARSKLEELGEQNALFKFVNLHDPTGLIELREYAPLQPATIRQLLRVAADEYDPGENRFWDIIDVVCETSHPEGN